MTKQYKIAEQTGISGAQLSRMLSGKSEIGKGSALKIQAVTGKPWNIVMAMTPDELRAFLTAAFAAQKQQSAA